MLNLQYSLPIVKNRIVADKHSESIQATGLGDWGGGLLRWISEVIRDDIFQRLQSPSKTVSPKKLLVSWEKVRKDPRRLQAPSLLFPLL